MEFVAFVLQVTGPVPGCAQSAAKAATCLVKELRSQTDLDVTLSGDAGNGRPTGGKGATMGSLAELVVAGLCTGSTMAAIARIAVAFIQRGAARRITLRDGARTLTVSDPSDETQRAVAEWLAGARGRSDTGPGAS